MGTIMDVPEASVNKDHLVPRRENKVRLTWQILSVESKPIAKSVRQSTHSKFNCSVLAADMRHDFAPLLFGNLTHLR